MGSATCTRRTRRSSVSAPTPDSPPTPTSSPTPWPSSSRGSGRSARAWTPCAPVGWKRRCSMPSARDGRSSASASACRCCSSRARRTPTPAASASSPAPSAGCRPASSGRRCSGTASTSSTLREPMFAGLGERPWFYFVHSLHGVPVDPSVVAATCDYGGRGQRRLPLRQRVRHPVPPREVGQRGPRPARQLRHLPGGGCLTTILYPSIDVRDGKVVRLAQGDYDRETVYGDDPVDVASSFCAQGAPWIHVVDLDAARTGEAVNRAVVAAIVDAVGGRAHVQAGGGVRTIDAAAALADAGVARVVMGSAAVADPSLVERVGAIVPVAVGLDHRAGRLAVHGWTETTDVTLDDALRRFDAAAAFVITDISRDGLLGGPDLDGLGGRRRRDRRAGDRQRRRRAPSTTCGPSRRSTGCTGSSSAGRCTTAGSPSPTPSERWRDRRPRDPVPRRHRRPCRQGDQLRRPARRRRSGGARRAVRRRGRRRARVPGHHGVERRPPDDARRRLPHRRAGVHPVHGRWRHPHAGGRPADAAGRCRQGQRQHRRRAAPAADRRDRHRVRRPVRRLRRRCQAARRRVRGLRPRRAHADGHRRRRLGRRRRRSRGAGRSCSPRWTATAHGKGSTSS